MSDKTKIKGMGSIVHPEGVAFRLWAPHAQQVSVIGSFNNWQDHQHPMEVEGNGYWYTNITEAHAGDEYRFLLFTPKGKFKRLDPYARGVNNSVGNAIVDDPSLHERRDDLYAASCHQLIIYELHVDGFNYQQDIHQLPSVSWLLGHLKTLGVSSIQMVPVREFVGDISWGYNPAYIFSVEVTYGGTLTFKQLLSRVHRLSISVILNLDYKHLVSSDLDLWPFDGWCENDRHQIYFYNDERAEMPYRETPPDYDGAREIRQYLLHNVLIWLDKCHVDGSRVTVPQFIRFDCPQFTRRASMASLRTKLPAE